MFRCQCKNDLPASCNRIIDRASNIAGCVFKLRVPSSVLIAVNYRADATNV